MMKKQLLLLVLTLLPMVASAHDIEMPNAEGVTIYYVKTNNTELAVSYRGTNASTSGNCYSGDITIPESVEYEGKTYSVTSIGQSAFYYCSITSVVIPNSVTSIGNMAFVYTNLSSIDIPNSVTSIGSEAFQGCAALSTISIPNSVSFIGSNAFSGTAWYDNQPNGMVYAGKVAYMYKGNMSLYTDLTIEAGTLSISPSAFYYCNNLRSVSIPNSVTSIGYGAFTQCTGLTTINIPNSVTSIGGYAFQGCSKLTAISIPNSVETIGQNAFYGCSGLTSVELHTQEIGLWFYNNESIKDVIIGDEVTSIGYRAFMGCKGLTNITIPNSVKTIGESAFSGCSNITNISIGSGVTSIGEYAFENCSSLASVNIPNKVTTIGEYSFYCCSKLISLTIGSGVTSINSNAFKNTTLRKVIWLTNTPPAGYYNVNGTFNYVSNDQFGALNLVSVYPFLSSMFEVDGIKYVPVNMSERTCDAIDCAYNETAENIHIGQTVTYKGIAFTVKKISPYTCYSNSYVKDVEISYEGSIGYNAFENCTNITNATLSNKGHVGQSAFKGCTSLATLTASNEGCIESNAFVDCSGLLTATLSNKGYIGSSAFVGCTSLNTVDISNEDYVGSGAFSGCSALQSAIIHNKGAVENGAFQSCSLLETAEIGENVTSLGAQVFRGCKKLQSTIIPNAVTSVGAYAYAGCSAMTTAKMGSGIELIDNYTFSECSSLKNLTIGSQVKTINPYAFNNCYSLPTITIPQLVTDIKDYVFNGCSKLKEVIIADSEAELNLASNGNSPLFSSCALDTVYIGRNIIYNTASSYGYSPFYRNLSLRAVKITDKETEISENEFYGCTNLQRVIIGDGVTTIGNWAFSGCSSLLYFSFGTQLATIGKEAFSDCTSVVEITSKATTPPVCGSQALDDINKWNCTLYVPEGYLAVYQQADQWKDFLYVEEGSGESGEPNPEDPENKKCATPTINYKNGKVIFSCETEGVEYVASATPLNNTSYVNGEMELPNRYRIKVYATKEGYQDSDEATKDIDVRGLKGDVNEDGVVSITDAVSVVNIILGGD